MPWNEELLNFLDIPARHHKCHGEWMQGIDTGCINKDYLQDILYCETRKLSVACKEENHLLHICGRFQGMANVITLVFSASKCETAP